MKVLIRPNWAGDSTKKRTRPPAPELVIAQLNREGAQQLVSSGAAAANALGLTTQMPAVQTFLARSRFSRPLGC